jgi:prefoldin subunit 5
MALQSENIAARALQQRIDFLERKIEKYREEIAVHQAAIERLKPSVPGPG